ncbi:uncharacterized protein HHUB_1384 [Halobacterium hubeiense]|uniref:Uncharacterized protein n=1 Tax=Halobacterium hubeiense TaxID=1407499 RepID=A0A0U5H1E8_9EURY|nr:uncharacterized protein HHUB_1384 [Halobacterium hubeiense]
MLRLAGFKSPDRSRFLRESRTRRSATVCSEKRRGGDLNNE